MTNAEIIYTEMVKNKIDMSLELHTYARWKQLGYVVKKGEKSILCAYLWKMTKSKKETEKDNDEEHRGMYLCKSYLFSNKQVEQIMQKEA